MLNVYTGRSRLLSKALLECVGRSQAETEIIVVPKQLTLSTEQMLLDGLHLEGSFRIQVLSAERLCARIFDAAGQPEGTRLDDRGRVMLVRTAIREANKNLTVYRGAENRRGFPERAADQLERIRQAQLTPDTLFACAEGVEGITKLKLCDLAYILEKYDSLIENRYLDGEAEFLAAVNRAEQAEFLSDCDVWFYGFDMMPPTLHDLIGAVSANCAQAGIFLALENDEKAPDFDSFKTMEGVMHRIQKKAESHGCKYRRIAIAEPDEADPALIAKGDQIAPNVPKQNPTLRHLTHGLFSQEIEPRIAQPNTVSLALLRNPREECRYAAALTRKLVEERNWRWNDVTVLVRDPEGYSTQLKNAFEEYDIPIFLSDSRPAARHAVAEYLLTAIKVIEKNYPQDDMLALMNTGMSPLDVAEAERFTNYAIRYGLRGVRFLRTLSRGQEAELQEMEPLREKLMAPLVQLRSEMRAATTLNEQLIALVHFLSVSDAYSKNEARIQELVNADMRETAGEEAQVWNRMMGTLDQMFALMGVNKLSLREIRDTLTESLSASVIRSLPQSADAVHAQGTDKACTRETKALIVVGMSDRGGAGDNGLLNPDQKKRLSEFAKAYLGPDDADLTRLTRYYLKCSLDMATEFVSFSCPRNGVDGGTQKESGIFDMIQRLFPEIKASGTLVESAEIARMLYSAPKAAIALSAAAFSNVGEGKPMSQADAAAVAGLQIIAHNENSGKNALLAGKGLEMLAFALNRDIAGESLSPKVAKELYGNIQTQSISRLERFTACPFSYFIQYGIRPESVDPFELNPADEGSFFHNAVYEFLRQSVKDLNTIDNAAAESRMDAISDMLLEEISKTGPLGDTSVTMAERRRLKSTMRVVATTLAEHMRGSQFHTAALEQSFGPEDGKKALRIAGNCILEGRIDRIDEWNGAERYLRIIDYKRGGKELKMAAVYHGLQLQLPIYLGAALQKTGAKSAGVYYFPLSEGILDEQSTDEAEIEKKRRTALRMEGLIPKDEAVQNAISASIKEVVKVGRTNTAEQDDYAAIVYCAMKRADESVQKIRSGVCAAIPTKMENSDPCRYCRASVICMHDQKLDAKNTLRITTTDAAQFLKAMREEMWQHQAEEKEHSGA